LDTDEPDELDEQDSRCGLAMIDERSDGLNRISHAVIGAAMEVSNTLGCGFLEKVYRRCLVYELEQRGFNVSEEVPFSIKYKGTPVGTYLADLVVEKQVIIELKATDKIIDTHIAQTLNYLRASGLQLGLVLNFGAPKLGIKRICL